MTFGLLHYTFLLTTGILFVCFVVLLKRYLAEKTVLKLAFAVFMLLFAVTTLTYGLRGLFDLQSEGDILLWKVGTAMTGITGAALSLFFAYPTLKAKTSVWMTRYSWFVIISSIVFLVIFITLPAVSEVYHTYTDTYGLSHYRLEYVIPYTYYLVVGPTLVTVLYVAVFLFVTFKNERDPFYRLRALELLIGWLAITLGQALLLSPVLSIVNPVFVIIGAFLLVHGVIRTKK